MNKQAGHAVKAERAAGLVATPLAADMAAVAAYVLLACLFFWQILFTNLVITSYDTFTIFYPHRTAAAQALLAGRLPLWNPSHLMGAPLLANPQVAIFYPLNWPFLGLPPGPSLAWTMALHYLLAALFMYAFARQALHLIRPAAWLAGLVFALGGFLSGQSGHLNQVSVAAWLPLVLLAAWHIWQAPTPRRIAAGAVIIALQVLAGHSQESYMILLALAAYAVFLAVDSYGWRHLRRAGSRLLAVAAAVVLGIGLSAVQLLPTLELSRLSIRSGGLSLQQASSFSLKPQDIALALLPNYAAAPPAEMAGYIGVVALLLAVLGAARFPRRPLARFFIIGALAGLVMALGRYTPVYWLAYYSMPGVNLFRVPARWLFLYTFAMSALAGMGLQVALQQWQLTRLHVPRGWVVAALLAGVVALVSVPWLHLPPPQVIVAWIALALLFSVLLAGGLAQRRPQVFILLIVLATSAELYLAGRWMDYNQVSPPEAVSALRPAVAYLTSEPSSPPWRMLSISDATWDPGDLQLIASEFPGLDAVILDNYIDTVKNKELLTANLGGLFGPESMDGYDGGVLPLKRYVEMEGLFLPPSELSPDGRLRDHLTSIPEARLLALLNVGYVIADKNNDVWIDNIYYDMAFDTVLTGTLSLTMPHATIADAVGLVSRLDDGATVAPGTAVAEITVQNAAGDSETVTVRAGEQTAATGTATSLHVVNNPVRGQYVQAVVPLAEAGSPSRVTLRRLPGAGTLHVAALSLIDRRTGVGQSLGIAPEFELVHDGDVKIYRNRATLPRAYVVHAARQVDAKSNIVAMMRAADFDPASETILVDPLPPLAQPGAAESVRMVQYDAQKVVVEAKLASPGLLVLSDAWYPGWQASVDGVAAPILRSNDFFRGVALPAGEHTVEFSYQPRSLLWGALIMLLSLVIVVVAILLPKARKAPAA